jgi:sulfite exporter TauE/SafE
MFTEANLLTALLLGLLLGVKHALDADHVVAVTTIVSRSSSILRSALVGLTWGIGHTLTLFAAGFAVLALKLTIPDKIALSMEFAVGVMLVLLGVPLLKQLITNRGHIHPHQHGDKVHFHSHSHSDTPVHEHIHLRRPLLVGMLHGLAGSAALTLLVLNTMSSLAQGLAFLLVFGVGSILSMLVLSGLISIPFKLTARFSLRLNLWVHGAAGFISIVLGLFIMWEIVFVGGLFSLTS